MVFIADISSVRDAPFDILMVCVGEGGGGVAQIWKKIKSKTLWPKKNLA